MTPLERARREEAGLGLIVAILVLLVVSAMGVAAINHSGSESVLGARQRRNLSTFFAAEAAIQLVANKVSQDPPDLTPVNQNLGDGTNLRTGKKNDSGPQNVRQGGTHNAPPDGFMINVGGGGFGLAPYYAEVTATGPDGSVVELEAKFAKLVMN